MRNDIFNEIVKKSEELSSGIVELVTFFNTFTDESEIGFDTSATIHSKDGSVNDAIARITIVTGVLESAKGKLKVELIPKSILERISSQLTTTINSVAQLQTGFESHATNNGGFTSFDYSNFHLQAANGTNLNLQAIFHTFYDTAENLLEIYVQNLPILRPTRASFQFQAAANALRSQLDELSKGKSQLEAQISELTESLEEIGEYRHSVEQSEKDTKSNAVAIQKSDENASLILESIEAKKDEIKEVHESATSLKKSVEEYQQDFGDFQKKLDERQNQITKGRSQLSDLTENLSAQEKRILKIIEQAESMLSGATSAGLANEFSTYRDKLVWSVRFAAFVFYMSLFLLFIFSIPLLVMVVPPLAGIIDQYTGLQLGSTYTTSTPDNSNAFKLISDGSARLIILVPFVWLATFASKRHGRLFRLKEHYAYKRSIAASVDGFKQQSPDYADEIAVMVFEELLFNPAEKMDKHSDEHQVPNPALNWVTEKIRNRKS